MKVLIIDNIHPFLINELEKHNIICHSYLNKTKKEICAIIKNYEGIIIRSKFNIDKDFIDTGKKLKFIARAGSGLENIDVKYAEIKKIACFNAPEGNRQAVAEHALAMILNLLNNINHADQEIRNKIWRREQNRGIEMSGKTFGIIGYGNNGSAFANLLQNFNIKILAYDKYKQSYPYQADMSEITDKADFISLHIPLNKETEYLVNNEFIKKMKKPFFLINTSRGKCVKTSSLVTGLKEKKIIGACLDVFEQEKNSFENLTSEKDSDFRYIVNSKKTILSPHIAGWTNESYYKISKILSEKIINYLRSD